MWPLSWLASCRTKSGVRWDCCWRAASMKIRRSWSGRARLLRPFSRVSSPSWFSFPAAPSPIFPCSCVSRRRDAALRLSLPYGARLLPGLRLAKPFCCWAALCSRARSFRLDRSGKFFGLLGQDLRLFFFAGWRFQRNACLPRYDMNVQVENNLTSGALVELLDGDSIRREHLHRGLGNFLCNRDDVREILCPDIENIAGGGFGQHQRMARRTGHDVEESERLVVFINLVAGQFATQDFGKYVVWIVARHRTPQTSWRTIVPETGPSD